MRSETIWPSDWRCSINSCTRMLRKRDVVHLAYPRNSPRALVFQSQNSFVVDRSASTLQPRLLLLHLTQHLHFFRDSSRVAVHSGARAAPRTRAPRQHRRASSRRTPPRIWREAPRSPERSRHFVYSIAAVLAYSRGVRHRPAEPARSSENSEKFLTGSIRCVSPPPTPLEAREARSRIAEAETRGRRPEFFPHGT